MKLAVECLDCVMRKRRQISIQRVLGFVKRLSTISAQLLPGACLAVMATIKRFIQVHNLSYTHSSLVPRPYLSFSSGKGPGDEVTTRRS